MKGRLGIGMKWHESKLRLKLKWITNETNGAWHEADKMQYFNQTKYHKK